MQYKYHNYANSHCTDVNGRVLASYLVKVLGEEGGGGGGGGKDGKGEVNPK